MLSRIIHFSVNNQFIVFLLVGLMSAVGIYSLSNLSIGAVPDITNNQVQVITTSNSLSTVEMEKYISYPIELEMANLPGVEEIRSISKFGISVVTVVFSDEMGTYLPRQLIAEKIQAAAENIPEAYGKPQMGPISTGLGEIYQYILDTEEGYEDRYSPMELTSIQNWIVKRQLSGIDGVVEVNTWGGYLKQYEVAISSARLNAMNISIQEVFEALEKNNGVTGAGYIEKEQQSYFIRGEGLATSIEDLKQIIVENREGIPILIQDVAEVKYGYANRFGAITANGEGEKVLGQVMMLKGANPSAVIQKVQERVEAIQKTLPPGVVINPILDRSELIDKTTHTIAENLILGCLIVIFVVVLLLGNWRSGLIVASIIPFSFLFALNMMYLFDVDANLMSLGAIDFGIIIDGAVIIVEFISYQLVKRNREKLEVIGKEEMKDLSIQSSATMMNSAIFGQLVILIVFIPIFTLQGVEGKMFIPMVQVFGFAILGAMILCLTYLPAASAIFLKLGSKESKSEKMIAKLHQPLESTLRWGLKNKRTVIAICLGLLIGSGLLFSRMGAEFVPTLDEGDFVIQPVLKTGTSLSETIDMTTKIEKILIDQFPEVEQIVSRIGAAEVPTDPMSLEEADVIINLKEKSEWVTADSKDELAEAFKEAIEVLGVGVEFTQPIEMRFNELITGVRSDIAIKLYGENLKLLDQKAQEIKALIKDVEGVGDIVVEKTVGLPQIQVKYKRDKIARYGLNVQELNDLLSLAYAGKKAGLILEEEKRFDLVVRLKEEERKELNAIEDLYVDLPNGGKIPLTEVADIELTTSSAKISRENTRRRVVVAVNVRNRDLQSLVEEIQSTLKSELDLPIGYSLDYGGQFENLNSAKKRLSWAVPLALILIFSMLYFAFRSWKEALLIFTAIPLSIVGGVLLLYLRGMPFSISAGIGFIALFGIAVLNGIVLIEHFKSLREEYRARGSKNEASEELVIQGSKDRLRAVILTASSTAMGFLPMAISGSAGAEVQRPLATVVIGGVISSTLLTLVIIPILYSMFLNHQKNIAKASKLAILLPLIFFVGLSNAQENKQVYTYEELKALCLENNKSLQASKLQVDRSKALINSSLNFQKTGVFYGYDENNLALNNEPLNVWGIQQDIAFPTTYFSGRKVSKSQYMMQSSQHQLRSMQIEQELMTAFQDLLYYQERYERIVYLDSIYRAFSDASEKSYQYGDISQLHKLTATSKVESFAIEVKRAEEDQKQAQLRLQALTLIPNDSFRVKGVWERLNLNALKVEEHPMMKLYDQKMSGIQSEYSYKKQQLLPDLSMTYFQGTNSGINENLIGYQFGLKIPLLFSGQSSQIQAANIQRSIVNAEAEETKIALKSRQEQLLSQLRQHSKALEYYENTGLDLADQIARAAKKSYRAGEINFFRYLESEEAAINIRLNYLTEMHAYNLTVVKLNFLMNE